jgi:four helix bundle protein
MNYNLEKRTLDFSKNVIQFLRGIRQNDLNRNLISQLVRAATSVGANYREANGASSKKDFQNKISICRKEVQETEYWLELLAESDSALKINLRKLWKEAHELTLIFNKIHSSLKAKL